MPAARHLAGSAAFAIACAIACSSTPEPAAVEPTNAAGSVVASEAQDPVLSEAPTAALPERPGPRRVTSGSVPHVQLDAELVPELDAELRRRVLLLPGLETGESTISLPGATGLWLSDETPVVRRDVLGLGREFAHIHPDGSLHVWLPEVRAIEVHDTQWGELHPWVSRGGFWNGVVMVFTPESPSELDVTIQIIVDAYNFVTGADIDAAEIA